MGDMKNCSVCKQDKELSEFYVQPNGYRVARCNDCRLEKSRANVRKYRYGLTQEQYDMMLEAQGHRCAVCGVPFGTGADRANIDHDHDCCPGNRSCGKCVRGVICSVCNTMAGAVENNLAHLDAMFEYLTFYLKKRANRTSSDEGLLEFLYTGPDSEQILRIQRGRRNK